MPVATPDIVSTTLDINVDSATRLLRVHARLDIRNPAGTRAFTFMLADWYDRVDVGANGARCAVERPGNGTISVQVPRTDTAIALTFELSGHPTSTSERRSVIGDSSVFLLWSDRFYPADFDDWSTMSIRVTLPSQFRVFAPGGGGEDSTANAPPNSRRWRFVTSQPIRAASIIADRRWVENQTVIGGRHIRTLLFANEEQFAERLMRGSADVLTEYERLFGPYPFESFTFAAVDSIFARRSISGGVIYAPDYLRQELDSTGRDAHETALLWWGYATAGRGDGSYQWTEGFGDYAEFLYDEARGKPIPRDFLLYRSGYMRTAGTAEELTYTNARGPLSGNFIHGRLPFLMHFLRFAVGDSAFRAGLHLVFDRYRYRTFTINEFVATMSEGAGRSVAWWKTEWLDRRGVPDLVWRVDDPPNGAASGTRITIEQRGAVYTLPVEIGVETRSDVRVVRVLLNHRRQTFDVPSDGPRPRVTIDPNGWLLARISRQGGVKGVRHGWNGSRGDL
jgi:hypothetical protein